MHGVRQPMKVKSETVAAASYEKVKVASEKYKKANSQIEGKYGKYPLDAPGYSPIPNIFFVKQNEFTAAHSKTGEQVPLEPLEICILLQMLSLYKSKDSQDITISQPFLAKRLGKSDRQIARSLKKLIINDYLSKPSASVPATGFGNKNVNARVNSYSIVPFLQKMEHQAKLYKLADALIDVQSVEEQSKREPVEDYTEENGWSS